jgi:hypothetical protein
MLVRTPETTVLRRWNGIGLEELAAQGLLHTDVGKWPAAIPWRNAATYQSGSIPSSYADIGIGFTTARVLPAAAASIQIERPNVADTGTLLVEYLDANWYHRSAAYTLNATTVTLSNGGGTASVAGQPVTAWRILSATYLGANANVGLLEVKIGTTNVQVRIAAGARASSMASTTVPRGQRLTITSYRAAIDTSKVISLQVRGGVIDVNTGVSIVTVRNETAEQNEHVTSNYRPENVQGVTLAGVRIYSPIDIGFLHRASSATTGTVDGTIRGVMQLDEINPDPSPGLIPWVAAAVLHLTAANRWPL